VRRLLLLVLAFIVYGTLYPWHFDFSPQVNPLGFLLHSWSFRWDRYLLRDVAVNVLIYVPLGAAAALALARKHSRAVAVGLAIPLGMVLSAALEMLQIYVPGRQCSLMDVVSNTAGTAAGALAALMFWPGAACAGRGFRGRRSPAFLLACWAGCQLYPFFPLLSRTRLWAGLALIMRDSAVSPVEIWACAAEWCAAALAMKALFGRVRLPWLVLAMACLPLRMMIAGRTVALDEALGSLLAVPLWLALEHLSGEHGRTRLAMIMLGLAILLRELAPFHFSATPAAFSWIPFVATFEALRQEAVLVVLRKTFDYGALVWLLRSSGLPYGYAGAAVAAALAVLEAAQRYLPGRTPEVTDSVLALLAAFVLWRLDSTARAPVR